MFLMQKTRYRYKNTFKWKGMFIFTNSRNLLIPLCSISFETNVYFPRKQNIPLKSVNQSLQDLNVRIELSSFNRTFCYSITHFIVVNIMQNIFDRLLLNLKKNSPLVHLQNHIHSLNGFSHTSIYRCIFLTHPFIFRGGGGQRV